MVWANASELRLPPVGVKKFPVFGLYGSGGTIHPSVAPGNSCEKSGRRHRTPFLQYSLSSPYSSVTLFDRRVAQSGGVEHDVAHYWQEEDGQPSDRRHVRKSLTGGALRGS
jgi:hypothetical protein